jgi:dihydroorotate dehydrogenase electron transfer subunit
MILFHSTVLQRETVTHDTFRIRLSCPEEFIRRFNPGQFVMVKVADFSHLDPLLKRPFSICRLREDSFELLIKAVGRGTGILQQAAVGSVLSVHGPLGNGFPLKSMAGKPKIMLVAGGIGIAPILCLLDELLASEHPSLELIMGARTAGELLCIDELRKLVDNRNGFQLGITTDDGSMGHHGLVTDLVSQQLKSGGEKPVICACGPLPMLTALGKLAMKASCSCYLSLESRMACGFGVCLGCVARKNTDDDRHPWVKICQDGPVFNAETLKLP